MINDTLPVEPKPVFKEKSQRQVEKKLYVYAQSFDTISHDLLPQFVDIEYFFFVKSFMCPIFLS